MTSAPLWLIPLLPLLGAALIGLWGKRFPKSMVTGLALGSVGLSLLLCALALQAVWDHPSHRFENHYFTWMRVDSLQVPFGFLFDALSATMALLVTGISFLIHWHSVGYMAKDPGYARYFSYLNLFVFFMLLLVLGNSLPLVFVGWEGVGLCSYLLIGFDYEKESAAAAGLKAFLTNRLGDLGVIVGMLLLFAHFGTLSFTDLFQSVGQLPPETNFGVLTLATLCIFVGATGKSAQLPLYIWLPDAMAGPTPVSALIHAATMVTAGIFLVCRMAPVFSLAPLTLHVMAWVGAATALFAATIGLLQRDIKKILAYSTVSQLGYMFLGLGASGFAAGFFHVFTHAWFKALLFLGAGSVIHALHGAFKPDDASKRTGSKSADELPSPEQDIFRMGGLKSKLPWTFWTMLAATACIIGFPGTSGFASKDEILYLAFLKSPILWGIGVLGACCTAFYMARMFTLVFLGSPRDAQAHSQAHESPWTMILPLLLLAIGALLAVVFGWPEALGGHFTVGSWLAPVLHYGRTGVQSTSHGSHALAWGLAGISTLLALLSAWFGYVSYRDGLARAELRSTQWPRLHRFVYRKYFVDEVIERFLLAPFRYVSNLSWKLVDVILIDGVCITAPAAFLRVVGDFCALLQTGRVRNYALSMGLGLLLLLLVFLR